MSANEATAPSPSLVEGEGKTELLWDQSECCFLSLLLSNKEKTTLDQISEEDHLIIDEQLLYSA